MNTKFTFIVCFTIALLASCSSNESSVLDESYEGKQTKHINWNEKTQTGWKIRFDDKGRKIEKFYVKNGKLDSIKTCWYDNGKVSTIAQYKKGKKDGLFKWFYEDGKLYQSIEYKEGSKNGTRKTYHENGNIKYQTEFGNNYQLPNTTKEFTYGGKLIPEKELIVVQKNTIKLNGNYSIIAFLEGKPINVEYNIKLNRPGSRYEEMPINDKNEGEIIIPVSAGAIAMESATIQATFLTTDKNIHFIDKEFRISFDNF